MAKVLVRAAVLIGLGIAIGCVHSQIGERPVTGLSQQPTPPKAVPAGPQANGERPSAPTVKGDPGPGGEKTPDVIKHTGPGTEPAVTGNGGGTATAPLPVQPGAGANPAAPANPADKYMITLAKAKELYDLKSKGQWDGVFIDARPYDDFLKGHIPGAMHIDKKYFDGAYPKKVKLYLQGVEVVIYCHGEQCTDSEAVAVRLQALKLNIGPIHIIKEGFPGWVGAKYPVDTGGEVGFDEK